MSFQSEVIEYNMLGIVFLMGEYKKNRTTFDIIDYEYRYYVLKYKQENNIYERMVYCFY